LWSGAVAAESSTVRIEERPYYGAVVTLESGVRVYRPLPPHSKVVINPGGRTPLNLTYEERKSVSYNYTDAYIRTDAPGGAYGAVQGGYYSGYSGHHHSKPHRDMEAISPRGHHGGHGGHR